LYYKRFGVFLSNAFNRLLVINEQAAIDRFVSCTWPTIIAQIIR